LERQIPRSDEPKLVIIGTNSDRHRIHWHGREHLTLVVPWKQTYCSGCGGDPEADLTDEQRALIGPNDRITILALPLRHDLDGNPLDDWAGVAS
jgi:hypothetical protein